MRSYPVKKNQIGSAVSEILQYRHTNSKKQTSCYFSIRIDTNIVLYLNLIFQVRHLKIFPADLQPRPGGCLVSSSLPLTLPTWLLSLLFPGTAVMKTILEKHCYLIRSFLGLPMQFPKSLLIDYCVFCPLVFKSSIAVLVDI